jgi:hypothetical protein
MHEIATAKRYGGGGEGKKLLRPELPARSTAAQGEEIAARKGGRSTKMRPARGLTRWAGAGAKVAYIVEVN